MDKELFEIPNYPEPVWDLVKQIAPHVKQMVVDDAQVSGRDIPNYPDYIYEVSVIKTIGDNILKHYLDEGEAKWAPTDEEDAIQKLRLMGSAVDLYALKDEGFLDSIEDENGEEMFFIKDRKKVEQVLNQHDARSQTEE